MHELIQESHSCRAANTRPLSGLGAKGARSFWYIKSLGPIRIERVARALIEILRSEWLVRAMKGGSYEAGRNLSLICAVDGMSHAQIQSPPFRALDEDILPLHHPPEKIHTLGRIQIQSHIGYKTYQH
jgi:hypothetical protein